MPVGPTTGLPSPSLKDATLDWSGCRAALSAPEVRRAVDEHTAAVGELGHWGVPLLVLDGEVFWGQDRVRDVEQALRDRHAVV
jgi:2-hydroxychromene-2-carboxylate isomerase